MFLRSLSALLLSGALFCAPLAVSAADAVSVDSPAYVLGSPDAPITIVEYSSFTCNHCATFSNDVLPKLKEEWIDTGKVKLVVHDFPLDQVALGISMLTYCAAPKNFQAMREAYFAKQDEWIRSKQLRLDLFNIAQDVGKLSKADSAKCLNNEELAQQIQLRQKEAIDELNIDSTPTFTVNGQIIRGAPTYDELVKILRAAGG